MMGMNESAELASASVLGARTAGQASAHLSRSLPLEPKWLLEGPRISGQEVLMAPFVVSERKCQAVGESPSLGCILVVVLN